MTTPLSESASLPPTPHSVGGALLSWTLLMALTVPMTSCGDEGDPGVDLRRQTLESIGHNVIMPMLLDFEAQSAQLEASAEIFCAAPDATNLETVRTDWDAARRPWKMMEVLNFGPIVERPERFGPKIDFWPVRPDNIEDVLAGDAPLDVETLSLSGTAVRGLPVIEYLIFQDASAADAVTRFEGDAGARRCQYLIGATADLANNASGLRAAWDPDGGDFLGELINAGDGSATFTTLEQGVGEIANRMAFTCENIRADKLGRPIGRLTDRTPQPELLESQFSDRATQDIVDNLRGIEAFFTGTYGDQRGMGFDEYAERRGIDLDTPFQQRLQASISAIEAIPAPMRDAVATDQELIEAAFDPIRDLQSMIQADLLGVLGVQATFNDADGD